MNYDHPTDPSTLGLRPSLLATLARTGITTLTEVQARALPVLLDRRSVVAVAETGSGKTLTYVLPILQRLKAMEEDGNPVTTAGEPRAIVIVPSRELADQVARVFKTFTHDTRLRVRVVAGGRGLRIARESVAGPFEVIVGTVGRLEQLVAAQALSLAAVRMVIVDEADTLLELGFMPQVIALIRACPSQRQLGLFSATMPGEIGALIGRVFSDAEWVKTLGALHAPPTLRTEHIDVPDGKRARVLLDLLKTPTEGGTILFANTRAQVDEVVEILRGAGLSVAVARGDMDPVERRDAVRAFRAREVPLLVTTDVAARGLDVDHVTRVVNVFLPHDPDAYLHRAGRTARAGRDGVVVNLVTPRDAELLHKLGDAHPAPEFLTREQRRRRR